MTILKLLVEILRKLYRVMFKRMRHIHGFLYPKVQKHIIPHLERVIKFRTLPDDPIWLRVEMLTENYEKSTVKLIKQLVKPGMIVLDLGANVGYYTKILSTLVGHDGHVIAFEPHPKVFRILSKNVAALSNVTSVQLSVSDKNEKQTLYDFLPWSGGSSLRYNNNERMWYNKQFPRIVSGADYATYAVMTTTVDSWLAENNVNTVDFVKMDIEGAEFNALRGMIKTTRKNEKLIMVMELNPVALESFGFDSQTVLSELHELGFRRVSIIGINGKLDPLDQHEFEHLTRKLKDTYSVANLLCIKH